MISDRNPKGNPETSEVRHHFGKGFIALAIMAGIMGLTNPPRDEYLNYASGLLAAQAKNSVCKESRVPDFLQDFAGSLVDTCQTVVTTQRGLIEAFLDGATHRQNVLVFSIYTTEVGNESYRTIGAFGNFLTFPPSSK